MPAFASASGLNVSMIAVRGSDNKEKILSPEAPALDLLQNSHKPAC